MSRIYGITSGKGGVGKSTVTANLGVALSQLGKKTLIIDADIAMGGLQLILGLQKTSVTLHEVLRREAEVEEAIYRGIGGVYVIPCGSSLQGFLKSDLEILGKAVAKLSDAYDFILIDGPAGLTKYSLLPIKIAEETLLVVTPDLQSISAALKMKVAAGMTGSKVGGVILNKQRRTGIKKEDIRTTLGVEVSIEIPNDRGIYKALDVRKPIVTYMPRSGSSKAFKVLSLRLAGEVDGLRAYQPGLVERITQVIRA